MSPATSASPRRQDDPPAPTRAKPERLLSLDTYRGFIMFTLAAAGFGSIEMARRNPDSFWPDIARQFTHVQWQGAVFWDMIMPAFLLMVGVAMPFSFASRRATGQDFSQQFRHAAVRALVLIVLGMVLMNQHSRFLNVLTQIGLGYLGVFLLLKLGRRAQILAIVGLLAGYWLLFALYPLPGPDYNFASAGAKREAMLPGFWAHWSRNVNIAADFDRWLLNLFPQDKPFVAYVGSVTTLNFIPAMANMILGLMCGQVLMSERSGTAKLRWLLGAGVMGLAAGIVLGFTAAPIVKKIWTPSYALYSAGWTILMLAGFYWVIDLKGWRRWTFPLVVFGVNSIAVYIMTLLWPPWISHVLKVQFGSGIFPGPLGPVWEKCAILACMWLFCWWLYRRKLFFKI